MHPMRDVLGELQSDWGFARFGGRQPSQTIGETEELRRVRDLPRRDWLTDPRLERLVTLLTAKLRYNPAKCAVPCEGCKAERLKPAQAQGLREAYNKKGAVLPFRVGLGKRLTSMLLPTILPSARPVLVVPGADIKQARKLHGQYARHWRILPIKIVSYEFLSHPKHVGWLAEYDPTLLVFDEAHKLQGKQVRKRVGKFWRERRPVICVLTGSLSGRSVMSYWHYIHWALPGGGPLPRKLDEAKAWGQALDEKILEEARLEPGELLQLGKYDPNDPPLKQARNAYSDRFVSTPGVVSTREDVPSVGLTLKATQLNLPKTLVDAVVKMRQTYTTPSGDVFSEPLTLIRHSVTLGAGLFMRWDPPAPKPWMALRKEWNQYARPMIASGKYGDSVVHLVNAIDRGLCDDGGALARWRQVEPTFKPNPVPVWIDTTAIDYAKDWIKQDPKQGLVWVAQREAGERLAKEAGLPFFSDGSCAGKLHVEDWKGPAIVSMHSCRERLNLQYTHSRNLLLTVPPKGNWFEQLMGRTHRDGQEADEVTVEVLLTTRESFAWMRQCVLDAEMDQQTHQSLQKLCYANRDLGPVEDMLSDIDMEIPGP